MHSTTRKGVSANFQAQRQVTQPGFALVGVIFFYFRVQCTHQNPIFKPSCWGIRGLFRNRSEVPIMLKSSQDYQKYPGTPEPFYFLLQHLDICGCCNLGKEVPYSAPSSRTGLWDMHSMRKPKRHCQKQMSWEMLLSCPPNNLGHVLLSTDYGSN